MDEHTCMANSNAVEHLGHQALDSKQHDLKDNYVEDKSMIEGYTLDTSLENCSLNEELLECLESSVKGNVALVREEMDHEKYTTGAKEVIEQFKSPIKSTIHPSLPHSTSPGLSDLALQTQTPSKAAANTSMDSLVDAVELDCLLDGVEWSPMVSCPKTLHTSRYM